MLLLNVDNRALLHSQEPPSEAVRQLDSLSPLVCWRFLVGGAALPPPMSARSTNLETSPSRPNPAQPRRCNTISSSRRVRSNALLDDWWRGNAWSHVYSSTNRSSPRVRKTSTAADAPRCRPFSGTPRNLSSWDGPCELNSDAYKRWPWLILLSIGRR